MARIRSLKPEIAADLKLASVSRDARYTFVLLITQADDEGLVAGSHRQLLGSLYPHDEGVSTSDLVGWINELLSIGVLERRETNDGAPVLEIANWSKHQRVDNKGRSQLAGILRPLSATRGELRQDAAGRGLEVGVGARTGEKELGDGERTEDRRPSVDRPSGGSLLQDYDFGTLAPQVAATCRLSLRPSAAAAILRLHLTAEAGYEPATPAEIGRACVAFNANGEEWNQALFAGYVRRAKQGGERTDNRRRLAVETQRISSEESHAEQATAEEREADQLIANHARDHPDKHAELQRQAEAGVPTTLGPAIRPIMIRVRLLRLIRGKAA